MEKKEDVESMETHDKIMAFLKESKIPFELTTHPPIHSAEEGAQFRGVSLSTGAKSMLVKDNSKSSVQDLVKLTSFIWLYYLHLENLFGNPYVNCQAPKILDSLQLKKLQRKLFNHIRAVFMEQFPHLEVYWE